MLNGLGQANLESFNSNTIQNFDNFNSKIIVWKDDNPNEDTVLSTPKNKTTEHSCMIGEDKGSGNNSHI